MTYEDILYEVAGGRATITINRPERLNAFRGRTILELCEAFEAAADDEGVGVIVFTGAGERAFCVGGDVREPTRTMAEKRVAHIDAPRLATAMRDNGKPILCRVRGYCIGGGNELNMISDLTISGTSGRFGQAGTEDRQRPPVVGLPAHPRGRRREARPRGALRHAPVQRRGGPADGAGERRRRPTRSSTPRLTAGAPRSCAARPRACASPRSP